MLAIPYQWNQGWLEKNTIILDWIAQHPFWVSAPRTPDDLRVEATAVLVNAKDHDILELWNGGKFAGLAIAHRIHPDVDCLFHFFLLPGTTLLRARKLLWEVLGYFFEKYDLQRISMEVPESREKYLRFLVGKLGFAFEGFAHAEKHELANRLLGKEFGALHIQTTAMAASWLARIGARRECAYWDGERYRDILLLRLLRRDYIARSGPPLELAPRASSLTGALRAVQLSSASSSSFTSSAA